MTQDVTCSFLRTGGVVLPPASDWTISEEGGGGVIRFVEGEMIADGRPIDFLMDIYTDKERSMYILPGGTTLSMYDTGRAVLTNIERHTGWMGVANCFVTHPTR